MTKGLGYIIPDPIDPEETICIRVYVPAHPLYVAAFMRAYQYFGQWVAWERDPTNKASQAAAVWRDAIERTQSEFDCSHGECGIMDIRQQTGLPCVIQKKSGCNDDWVTAVDMRLCVPKMRISGGVIEQDTTGSGGWVSAQDTPYDPRVDSYAPAPWTNPPEGEDGECLSAANVAAYVDYVSSMMAGGMVDALTFFQTISLAMTILTALMQIIPLTALTAVITALYDTVVDSWVDVRDYSIINKLTELMACKYEPDGSMTSAGFGELIDACWTWRNSLNDTDHRAKWSVAIGVMSLWGPVGMTLAGKIWGITTYECEFDECDQYEWAHTFDFTTSDCGFVPELVNGEDAGEYVAGVGWRGVYTGQLGYNGAYRAWLLSPQVSDVTYVRALVEVHYESGINYRFCRAGVMADESHQGDIVASGDIYDNAPSVEISTGEGEFTGDQIRCRCGAVNRFGDQPPQLDVGGLTVTRIVVYGNGTNPWA